MIPRQKACRVDVSGAWQRPDRSVAVISSVVISDFGARETRLALRLAHSSPTSSAAWTIQRVGQTEEDARQ